MKKIIKLCCLAVFSLSAMSASAQNSEELRLRDSLLNVQYQALVSKPQATLKASREKYEEMKAAGNTEEELIAQRSIVSANKSKIWTETKDFIKAHPNDYLSLTLLSDEVGIVFESTEIDPIYNSLSAELKETSLAKTLETHLKTARLTALGTTAPAFTAPTPDGKNISLADYKGKYLLIDFWASWCGPCRGENPNVLKAYELNKGKNFDILGVSLDALDKQDKWIEAIKEDALPWKQVIAGGFYTKISDLYGVYAIPQNFLLDPDGKIIAKNLRGEDLSERIAELIK